MKPVAMPRWINAHIAFKDKLGNTLVRRVWAKSRGIPAGKAQKMSGSYSSIFGSDGLERLVELDRSLLDISFEVYKIAFQDGEIVQYRDCNRCDFD